MAKPPKNRKLNEIAAARENEILRRMLSTPPKPHKAKPKKRPRAKKSAVS